MRGWVLRAGRVRLGLGRGLGLELALGLGPWHGDACARGEDWRA